MEVFQNFWQILVDSLLLTARVSLFFFGGVLILGLLLYLLARFTRNLFAKTFGSMAEVYITAWVGTPIHELGHAIFCIFFMHKIRKITLFNPNSKDGSLGAVEHSYNSRNIYHLTGNFFIGAGPLFFGSLVIYFLSIWLLPEGINFQYFAVPEMPHSGSDVKQWLLIFEGIFQNIASILQKMFVPANYGHWQFWLFLYLSLAIASHMELSPPDLKQMWSGLFVILLLIFLFHLIYLLFFSSHENILLRAVSFFALMDQLLMVGLVFSAINFIITWIITTLYSIISNQNISNPFTR